MQWWHMSSAAGGLAQEVLRTHYRLLDFNPKNSTGPKPKCLMLILSLFPLFCLMGGSGANIKGMLMLGPPPP